MCYLKTLLYLFLFICIYQLHAQKSDFDHIDFKKADSIAAVYKNEKLTNLPGLSYKLTSQLTTDVERFRAIYKWVCENVANNYKLYYKNKRKRKRFKDDSLKLNEWNTSFRKIIFKTLIKKEETICTGYAYLIKELSELAYLDCKIIDGYGKTSTTLLDEFDDPNHSWNAIKLNDKWYLCDATWASGSQSEKTYKFKFDYNDGFFLAEPQLFAINHYPSNKKWLLTNDDSYSYNAFLESPILYNKAYSALLLHKSPNKMHQLVEKNEKIIFEYQLQHSISKKDISLIINNGFEAKKVNPNAISIEKNTLTLEYEFKNNGFYDFHVLIENEYLATYTFKVKS